MEEPKTTLSACFLTVLRLSACSPFRVPAARLAGVQAKKKAAPHGQPFVFYKMFVICSVNYSNALQIQPVP